MIFWQADSLPYFRAPDYGEPESKIPTVCAASQVAGVTCRGKSGISCDKVTNRDGPRVGSYAKVGMELFELTLDVGHHFDDLLCMPEQRCYFLLDERF
jgi:hypothetical protein